ncbi:rhomboid family intramembrane serine protease [Flavobacterium sp.]|uniref:rhomboid family intramembrane serine protease n=1 Tax=Flavobacterium sp. TaxID=239 RepID=UPI00260D0934|nr:rhomboid family intramembrane serine protease [Flavobacterium sp.]MDD2985778.1 rhomboid family intramembrane serine protease [Flavobacterium sp.]
MNFLDEIKQQYRLGGVTEKLIYWNVTLFAIPWILTGILSLFGIQLGFMNYVSLSSNPTDLLWKPWSIFTYAFFHADIFHILFNLIILNFVGRLFLTFFTQKQLLSLYFMGLIFAGLIYILSYLFFPALANQVVTLIGASGAIMAVLFGVATYAPQMQVRLLLIGNIRLWHIAVFYVVVDLISLSFSNVGGHIAHLGGALFGYLYASQLQKGNDLTKGFSSFMDWVVNLFQQNHKTPFKKVHKNNSYTQQKHAVKDKSQQQIDEILDKISQSGYDSLTKEEKEFLFKAGKN